MSAVAAEGTQTATLTTEHTLLDTAVLGTYALLVNLSNMLNGDLVELTLYGKAITGGTYAVMFRQPYEDSQALPLSESFHIYAPYGAKFTLKQTVGTGRAYEWTVYQLDG